MRSQFRGGVTSNSKVTKGFRLIISITILWFVFGLVKSAFADLPMVSAELAHGNWIHLYGDSVDNNSLPCKHRCMLYMNVASPDTVTGPRVEFHSAHSFAGFDPYPMLFTPPSTYIWNYPDRSLTANQEPIDLHPIDGGVVRTPGFTAIRSVDNPLLLNDVTIQTMDFTLKFEEPLLPGINSVTVSLGSFTEDRSIVEESVLWQNDVPGWSNNGNGWWSINPDDIIVGVNYNFQVQIRCTKRPQYNGTAIYYKPQARVVTDERSNPPDVNGPNAVIIHPEGETAYFQLNQPVEWHRSTSLNRQEVFLDMVSLPIDDNNPDVNAIELYYGKEYDVAGEYVGHSFSVDVKGKNIVAAEVTTPTGRTWPLEVDENRIGSAYEWKQLNTPPTYITPEVIQAGIVLPCDDYNLWHTPGAATFSYDTNNVQCTSYKLHNRSIKVTGGFSTLQAMYYDFGASIDLTKKIVAVRFYIAPGTDLSNPCNYTGFYLYLSEGTALPYGPLEKYFGQTLLAGSYSLSPDDNPSGWYEKVIPLSSFKAYNGADITKIRTLWVWAIKKHAGDTPSFTLDRVLFYNSPLTAGMYAIRIDSSVWSGLLPVCSYASSKGVRLTIGVSPWYICGLTVEQMRLLEQMGHELAVYGGYTYGIDPDGDGKYIPNNWVNKSRDEKIWQLQYARNFFKIYGFSQKSAETLFCSGGSVFSPWDNEHLKPRYCPISSILLAYPHGLLDVSSLNTSHFIDTDGPDQPANLAAMIANTEADKTCLILGSHVGTVNQRASLMASIDSLAASALVNKTFSEIYSGGVCQPPSDVDSTALGIVEGTYNFAFHGLLGSTVTASVNMTFDTPTQSPNITYPHHWDENVSHTPTTVSWKPVEDISINTVVARLYNGKDWKFYSELLPEESSYSVSGIPLYDNINCDIVFANMQTGETSVEGVEWSTYNYTQQGIHFASGIFRGDFDDDGDMDFYDLAVISEAWLSKTGDLNWNPVCDISEPKDGIINWLDFALFAQNWLADTE